jgi:hypothetical protein
MEEATQDEIADAMMTVAPVHVVHQDIPRAPKKTAVNDGFGLIRHWLVP